jgi:tetratricopeptide (TPR) repeat protein
MNTFSLAAVFLVLAGGMAFAQVEPLPPTEKPPGENDAPPRDDDMRPPGVSSSRDTRIDISPPADDAKAHPNSTPDVTNGEDKDESDEQEMHPFDPHKAAKDIEVGDFYFRRKNYHGAEERYRDALAYKPGDAIANFKLGEVLQKLDQDDEALSHYQAYLKVLPHGPLAKEAEKAVQKLNPEKSDADQGESKP